jgi:hypothetical protein
MTVRTKIRMAWTFEGCDEGHTRLDVAGNQMRAEGMSREAIARVLGDKVLSIADVEIDDAGTIRILSIRPIARCPHVDKGFWCDKREEHGPDHCGSMERDGETKIHRWTDGSSA